MAHPQLELIDPMIDATHRSQLDNGQLPPPLGLCTPEHLWRLDERWIPRYFLNYIAWFIHMSVVFDEFCIVCRLRAAGLLPLARLVEATGDRHARFPMDRALVSALVDHWRPETHTFHLLVGEMTPTLQDVSMLLGLRIVGARCTLAVWRPDGGNTSFTVSRVFYHQQVHMFA